MTIDERLQFLVQSTESLHASVQELSHTLEQERELAALERDERVLLEQRERKGRQAILAAIQSYLSTLNNGDGSDTE